MPVFWDEASYISGSRMIWKNNLNPFIEFHSYKPPLIFELAALGYQVFGYSLIIPRIITIFFAAMALGFTYLLGRKLYNKEVGILASTALLFFPMFFAQSGLFHASMALTALTIATFYFYVIRKRWYYLISGTFLVLTKEVGILVIIALVGYDFLMQVRKRLNSNSYNLMFKETFVLFFPIIPFFIWMLLNKVFLGWFLWPYNASFFQAFSISLYEFKKILINIFVQHYISLLYFAFIIGVLASLFNLRLRKLILRKEVIFFILLVVINILFFAWMGTGERYHALPRYFLHTFPFIAIFGTVAIKELFRKKVFYLPILLAIIILFVVSLHPAEFEWTGERDLGHREMIETHQKVASFLETNYSKTKIVATFPLGFSLKETWRGYVNKPLDAEEITGLFIDGKIKDEIGLQNHIDSIRKEGDLIIVIDGYYKFSKEYSLMNKYVQTNNVELLKGFESKYENVTIYYLEKFN